jgi:hypothetical protein
MENRTMNHVAPTSRISVALSYLVHPVLMLLVFIDFIIVHLSSDHRCICEITGLALGPIFASLIAVVIFGLLWLIAHGMKQDGWFIKKHVIHGLKLQRTLLIWWLVTLFFLALYIYFCGSVFCVSFLFGIFPVLTVLLYVYYMVQAFHWAYGTLQGRELNAYWLPQDLKDVRAALITWYHNRFNKS